MKMNTTVLGIVLAMIAAGLAQAVQVPIGKALQVEGAATVRQTDKTARTLVAYDDVHLYDTIETDQKARVEVEFLDGTRLYVAESSSIRIDEYVYSPELEEENATGLNMIKGAFRVITGKITDLNPERFKVKARHGTIGIRGTDLGFNVNASESQVFFLDVEPERKVRLDLTGTGQKKSMEVGEDGIVIAMDAKAGFTKRAFNEDELRDLIFNTTPLPGALRNQVDASQPTTAAAPPPPTGNAPADAAASVRSAANDAVKNTRADSSDDDLFAAVPPQASTVPPERSRAPATGPSYPIVEARKLLTSDSGLGGGATPQPWSWELWSQKTTDLVGGAEVATVDYSRTIGGRQLSTAELTAINDLTAGTLVSLTGSGPAGAVVADATQSAVLGGTMQITSLVLGKNVLPFWNANFNMNGSGNTLAFSIVNGSISTTDGTMGGTASAYSLNAFGQVLTAGSLSASQVAGQLVGAGTGADPVSGAVVGFGFEHGAQGIGVEGAGGANLN